jgi:hypothetical protein
VEPLEVPRREAELSRVSGIQGGTPFLGGEEIYEFGEHLGDLSTWVILAATRSTVWHLHWSIWASLVAGPNLLRLFSDLAGRGIFQLGGLTLHTAQIVLYWSSLVYLAFGGL